MTITLDDGATVDDQLAGADAPPAGPGRSGAPPWREVRALADGMLEPVEQDRFLDLTARLPRSTPRS